MYIHNLLVSNFALIFLFWSVILDLDLVQGRKLELCFKFYVPNLMAQGYRYLSYIINTKQLFSQNSRCSCDFLFQHYSQIFFVSLSLNYCFHVYLSCQE